MFIAIIIFSEDMYLKPKETAKRDDILIFLHDKLNLQTTISRRRTELFKLALLLNEIPMCFYLIFLILWRNIQNCYLLRINKSNHNLALEMDS